MTGTEQGGRFGSRKCSSRSSNGIDIRLGDADGAPARSSPMTLTQLLGFQFFRPGQHSQRCARGQRPCVVRDFRYKFRYLFAATCATFPQSLLWVVIQIPDNAGWHVSKALEVPVNETLARLPPNGLWPSSTENVFAWLKGNFLANRTFPIAVGIHAASAEALQDQMSVMSNPKMTPNARPKLQQFSCWHY